MIFTIFLSAVTFLIFYFKNKILKAIQTTKRELSTSFRFARVAVQLTFSRKLNRTIHDDFDIIAKKYPNKVCFFFEDQKWTFAEVERLSNQVANYFLEQGFAKGDKIGIFMENRVEYICIWLGLAKIGVVSALINTNVRNNALSHCLTAGNCTSVIFGSELASAIQEISDQGLLENQTMYHFRTASGGDLNILPQAKDLSVHLTQAFSKRPIIKQRINYNDELVYIYTSGTTGLPKAAIIKHSRFLMLSKGFATLANYSATDVVFTPLPLYHAAGICGGIGQALLNGSSVVFIKKFSASRFWDVCRKHNVTIIQYIGEICRFLLASPSNSLDQVHSVTKMFGNGLRPEIWADFIKRFNIKNVAEVYSSTEGNCAVLNFTNKVGAVGYIPKIMAWYLPIKLIKVDEETGDPIRDPVTGLCVQCGTNEAGEVIGMIQRGNAMTEFEGYTDEASKNKKILSNVLQKGDQAFRSGDILIRDEHGYYFFKDRQGDTYRWKGENVSTMEVQDIVTNVSGHADAAVYGVEIPGNDGRAGMVAIVDPGNKLDLVTLATELNIQLPSYARPLFLRKIKKMDFTGTFKFKKGDLQKQGFDITKIQDPVYFFTNGVFVPLDIETFTRIMERKIRV